MGLKFSINPKPCKYMDFVIRLPDNLTADEQLSWILAKEKFLEQFGTTESLCQKIHNEIIATNNLGNIQLVVKTVVTEMFMAFGQGYFRQLLDRDSTEN